MTVPAMTSTADSGRSRSLAQTLAVQTQVHLPGTVGRLLKQIRDLEQVAPLFRDAGLVRPVERPKPLSTNVAGIATHAVSCKAVGGFLYVAAAARFDLTVKDNFVATRAEDSECEIDDIDYEDQSKRFQLVGVRQAYRLAERALASEQPYDLILLDCPLLLNRSMVAPQQSQRYSAYREIYEATISDIGQFWTRNREQLFPWNPRGPIMAGIASQRFGAIVSVSQQDFRTDEGRKQVLHADQLASEPLARLNGRRGTILGVGERRFITGILGSYTRTAAFRMNVQTPRMEPASVADLGATGLHYCGSIGTPPRMIQVIGDEPGWQPADFDKLAGTLMALTVAGGSNALPMALQLATAQLEALKPFLEHYASGVRREMKSKQIEDVWLSEMDEL
ncbi:MAG TPA: hypothetical protein VMV69_19270 [Pirellulales bacterium]|nr:hypothetical protein [Pirellulales bacterium]